MIQTVLFDFGGVLTEGGKLGSIRAMFARAYGVESSAVELNKSVEAAFLGTISDEEFVTAINHLNSQYPPVTTGVLMDNGDIYDRSEPVYELAARLRAAGIATGVFSNIFATSAALLRKAGCYDGFSPLFLSCEQHLMKPDRRFYEHVLTDMGLDPSTVLFIDDKEECLVPARELGMHTVLAVDPKQIVHDVTERITTENAVHI